MKPFLAYCYAAYVQKGPFPEGEDAIAKSVDTSLQYAKYVLKGRFLKGEPTIIAFNATGPYESILEEVAPGQWDDFMDDHSQYDWS